MFIFLVWIRIGLKSRSEITICTIFISLYRNVRTPRHTVYTLLNELSAKQSVFVAAVDVVGVWCTIQKNLSLFVSHTHKVFLVPLARTLFYKSTEMLNVIFKSVPATHVLLCTHMNTRFDTTLENGRQTFCLLSLFLINTPNWPCYLWKIITLSSRRKFTNDNEFPQII